MPNPKTPMWYGNTPALMLPDVGKIFYVHTAASGAADTNDGLTPSSAFLTIDHAVGECSGVTDDYIFVIQHDDATETYPIEMDVNLVHLIGTPEWPTSRPRIRVQGDVDGFDITATRVEIAGFNINTNAQGDTGNLIHLVGGSQCLYLHHNYIAWNWWGGNCCINMVDAGLTGSDSLIEHNWIGAHGWNVGGIGINIGSDTGRVVIRDNVIVQPGFQVGGSPCVRVSSANHCCILNNTFHVSGLVDGEAIHVNGETNLVDGNHAAGLAAGMGAVHPYTMTTGQVNYWGANWAANALVLPQLV